MRRCSLVVAGIALSATATHAEPEEPAPPALRLDSFRSHKHGVMARTRSGAPATLTLDPALQQVADKLLSLAHPVRGSIVMIDVASGKLRVLAHYASGGERRPHQALSQRAPSASVFKLVTSAALLERTSVGPQTKVCVAGGERSIERRHLAAPRASESSCFPFSQVLGFSVNAAFAQLATEHLLRDDLVQLADKFGFGRNLPLDVPAGLGELNVPYNDLDFARTAAGFQNSQLSPLGAAYLSYVIASAGMAPKMSLIEEAPGYRAPLRTSYLGRVLERRTARRLAKMMEVTVHSGTSLSAFTGPNGRSYLGQVRVAGKTGTLHPHSEDTTATWFTGFAPSEQPKVVVSVLLENGERWRRKANEIARDMLREYFSERGDVTPPFGAEQASVEATPSPQRTQPAVKLPSRESSSARTATASSPLR